MKAEYRIADPEEVECSLTLTMRVTEWRSLLLKINESAWPASSVGRAIHKLIADANQKFSDTSGEFSP